MLVGFRGRDSPLIVGCREIEISRSGSTGETVAGAVRLDAG